MDYDLWFSSFETVNLELNDTASPNEADADTLTIDHTFYIDQLNVDIGNGDNLVNITGLGAHALIETGTGDDKFVIQSLSNERFATSSLDVATLNPPTVENDRVVINANGGDDSFYLNYYPVDSWSSEPEQTDENGIFGIATRFVQSC